MRLAASSRATVAEFTGTALLVCCIVGSGIMAETLSNGSAALALLANSLATGAVLLTLIFTFAPISGAHFNPVVTMAAAMEGAFAWSRTIPYVIAQCLGALTGVMVANLMFGHAALEASARSRSGPAQLLSEFVATFGLVVIIHGTGKRAAVVPLTVAAYITAAYWFTSSTSFANPAVTLARAFTNSFSGIQLTHVLPFIAAQTAGALAATLVFIHVFRGEE
ncbi:MAG TPA: MIP/aquaporin family protein [Thermoanaerobaculia bacterium]|nr:MIP/aquaporin family protein [Thermoanaerobaculia bacterium]